MMQVLNRLDMVPPELLGMRRCEAQRGTVRVQSSTGHLWFDERTAHYITDSTHYNRLDQNTAMGNSNWQRTKVDKLPSLHR